MLFFAPPTILTEVQRGSRWKRAYIFPSLHNIVPWLLSLHAEGGGEEGEAHNRYLDANFPRQLLSGDELLIISGRRMEMSAAAA